MTAIKWLLTLAMLAYALHEIDGAGLRDMLLRQNPLTALAVVALFMVQMMISTFRWQRVITLLTRHRPTLGFLTRLNFISVFFNTCLPGNIGGDVVRAMMLKSPERPLSLCIHSVIIDRLLAVLGIVAMVALSLPLLSRYLPELPVPTIAGALLALTLISLLLLAKATALLASFHHVRPIKLLSEFLGDMGRVVFAPASFALMLLQAALAHACFCIGAFMLAASLGAPLSLIDSLILIPPVLLLMMLPISIGGWGVRELSMVHVLALVGVSQEASITISVQLGILMIVTGLPGAWLYARRRKAG